MDFRRYLKTLYNGTKANSLVKCTIKHKIVRKLFGDTFAARKYERKKEDIIFHHQFNINKWNTEEVIFSDFEKLYKHYCHHEFNLLGSSFVRWEAGNSVLGFQGCKVKDEIPKSKSDDIAAENTDADYHPIAWNVDIKTGYLFKKLYYDPTLIGELPQGTDIKVPWELGRMYHWPQLALYVLKAKSSRAYILQEFKNQMEDFMVSNPIGKGVQFYCAMEVAIRAVNLLIAYDLLLQVDTMNILKNSFQKKFEQYIYMHGAVISHNMEYDYLNKKSGNHYLADLCGLLWISLYFPSKRSQKWQKVSKNELFAASGAQFLPSGCNFECSTSYHRLTTELYMLSFLALIKGNAIDLDEVKEIKVKLKGMYQFLLLSTEADGDLIQIGDNDSGSVLKLFPNYCGDEENTLNADFLTSAIEHICQIRPINKTQPAYGIIQMLDIAKELRWFHFYSSAEKEKHIVKCLDVNTVHRKNSMIPTEIFRQLIKGKVYKKKKEILLSNEASFVGARLEADLEFGLIKISGKNIDFFIRTIPNYNRMELAHAHDDVFHFELCMNQKRYFSDRGSIVYTASKDLRYEYSSSKRHNVPIHKIPILKRTDIFQAESNAVGKTIIESNYVAILVKNYEIYHIRRFIFETGKVIIEDFSNQSFKVNYVSENGYSKGYGQLEEKD